MLSLVRPAYGVPEEVAASFRPVRCEPGGSSLAERMVYGGESFRSGLGEGVAQPGRELPWPLGLGAADVVAVPWRAGDRVLGIVTASGARGASGFSPEHETTLQVASVAAGLLWQQRERSGLELEAISEQTEEMRSTAERYAELEAMKGRILNLAAHELRGPVTVISGYLTMIADGSVDQTMLRRILPILIGKAAQMDMLITQMLEAARLEEGKLQLEFGAVDLGAVARKTVDVAALLAPAGLAVFLEEAREPVLVEGDRERLGVIVANLVDNAMKYSPEGGIVRVSVGSAGDRGYVRVTDTGLGIDAEHLPMLFTRFGRIVTSENSHIGGTGLGLHLSQELARLHGGEITASSEPGAGSVFTLWVPLRAG